MKRLLIILSCVLCSQSIFAQSTTSDDEEISRDTIANMVIVQRHISGGRLKCWDVFFDNFSHEYAVETERRSYRDSIRRPKFADISPQKDEHTFNVTGNYAIAYATGDDITQILNDSTVIDLKKWQNIGGAIIPSYTLDRHSHLRQLHLLYYCNPDKEDTITAVDVFHIANAIDTRIVFGNWAAKTADRKFFDFLIYITFTSPVINRYALGVEGGIVHPRPEQRFGRSIQRDSIR